MERVDSRDLKPSVPRQKKHHPLVNKQSINQKNGNNFRTPLKKYSQKMETVFEALQPLKRRFRPHADREETRTYRPTGNDFIR